MDLSEKKEIGIGEIKKEITSINDTIHTIQFVDPYKFKISDTRKFTKYIRNGIAKQVKLTKEMPYKELKDVYYGEKILHDSNLTMLDFAKTDDITVTHIAFEALNKYELDNKKLPGKLLFKINV